MQDYTKDLQRAVEKAISDSHKRGFPVYQCKDGYIIAIYPEGREVILQKAIPYKADEKD